MFGVTKEKTETMKIGKIILATILISIFACNDEVNQSGEQLKEVENEIRKLETTNDKKIYLEQILEKDQAVRDGEKSAELMLKYGKDSEEYIKVQLKQDEINLIKIEKYLEIHGYPEKEMGDMATTAP
jgi:predicted methyltransferase MtxX (methanogen marker protein 4)